MTNPRFLFVGIPKVFLSHSAILLLFVCATATVFAQRNPPMAEQQRDAEKETYFARFNDLKRIPTAENQRLAYEAAVEYLKRFEGDNDPDAKTVRKFVTQYEGATAGYQVFAAYNAKNYSKAFELGRPILQRQPENFFILSVLTEAGFDNALGGNASFNEATVDYAKRAIQLLETGKLPSVEPFKNIEAARGFLNAALGTLLREKAPVEAAQAFRKAVQSDSFYRTDPLTYHRLGVAILKGEFAQLSTEYNEKFGAQQSSSAQQAMLERINKLVEQAIDAYARSVALSDPARPAVAGANTTDTGAISPKFPPELRAKILEQLTALYKNFHNNSDAGLNELLSTVLTKPLP